MFYIVILILMCISAQAALRQKAFNNNYPKGTTAEDTYTDLGSAPVGRLGLTQEQIDEIQEEAHERLQILTGERLDTIAETSRIGEISPSDCFETLRNLFCCCCKRKKE